MNGPFGMRIRFLRLVGALLLALPLGGCLYEEKEDLNAWMTSQSQGMRGRVAPLPEIKPYESVKYDGEVYESPFSSDRITPEQKADNEGSGIKPDFNRRKEPLEAYPLESLSLVGMLQREDTFTALVLADQTVHQVRVGNYMGQDFGVVTRIDGTEMELKELTEDAEGEWQERIRTVRLEQQESN